MSPCYRLPTFGMPRVYKKKGSKNKWTDEQLREGLGKIKTGELSLRAAAVTYHIPKSTLSDHLRGTSSKRYGGGSTVLSMEEEREIVLTCQVLADMGFPLTRGYVSQNRCLFGPSGVPGRSWWEGFMARWPSLAERKPQHLARQRAQCSTSEVVDAFFIRLTNFFDKTGLADAPDLPNRIWNCDETGFCTAVSSKTVLARRGTKEVHETTGGSEENTSLC